MSEFQVQGRLTKIFNPESGVSKTTGKEWNNLTFMVTTEGDHPEDIAIGLFGEKTSYLDKFSVGDLIDVKFNIRSKEFNGKAFTNLNAYSITGEAKQNTTGGGTTYASNVKTNLPKSEMAASQGQVEEDLPF